MPELNFNALAQQGPQGVYQGFMQGQQLRNQLAGQEQQRQLGELQLQNALREQRLAGEEEAAYKAAGNDYARLQSELMQRGLGKQALAVGAQQAKMRADQLKMHKDTVELTKTAAQQVMANPQNAAQILSSFGQRYGIDMADDLAQIQQLGGNPDAIRQWAAGVAVQADKLLPKFETMNLGGGVARQGYSPITGAPVAPATFTENVPLPAAVEAQKARIAKAGASNINLPAQEKSFEQELGKGQADRILKSKVAAEDAAQILQTNQVGRDILKSGAITGAGANFFVGLNNALQQGGIDFGYADAAANSQAYAAAMAQNVGKLIKQYGAGTGLSDADRNYATKAAAGEISMDEKAIRKILDINDRAANFVIDRHNKDVQGIKTNVPLSVEKPVVEQPRQPAAAQIPGQRPAAAPAPAPAIAVPQAAIDALKAGRGTDAQFDEIFGPGAAKRARGGK